MVKTQVITAMAIALSNMFTTSVLAQDNNIYPPSASPESSTVRQNVNSYQYKNKNASVAITNRNIYQCVNYQGIPTTVVDTPRGRIKLIVWESQYFSNSGWTPEKRCQAVSARFQKFSDDRTLKYVSTGLVQQKYKVICVSRPTPGKGYHCNQDGLLITLQPNDNPSKILNELFVDAAKVGGTAVVRGETAISIDRILDRADVISPAPVNSKEQNSPTIMPQKTKPQSEVIKKKPAEVVSPNICSPPLCQSELR